MTAVALAFVPWMSDLAGWTWRASWQSAALAAVVAIGLCLAGRRISPAWRFALWGLVLARLVAPPIVELDTRWAGMWGHHDTAPIPLESGGVVTQVESPAATPALPEINPEASANRQVPSRSTNPISNPGDALSHSVPTVPRARAASAPADDRRPLASILAAIWLTGAALLLCRVLVGRIRLARVVRRLRPVTDGRLLRLWAECARQMRVARPPLALSMPCGSAGGPALVGVCRPRVLLPESALATLSDDQIRLVLLHELAHVRRRDVLWNWMATLVCVAHWPNPVAWLAAWRMRVERELACDERVLRTVAAETNPASAPARAYADAIVRLIEILGVPPERGSAAVALFEGKSQVQRRLVMITRFESGRNVRRWPLAAGGLAAVLTAAAFLGAARAEKPAEPLASISDDKAAPQVAASIDAATQKFKTPLQVNFDQTALCDVIEFMRSATGVDLIVDWNSLASNGVAKDVAVSLKLTNKLPADAVLNLIGRQIGIALRTEVETGGVIVISATSAQADAPSLMKVYDVADLIKPEVHPVKPAAPTAAPGAAEDAPAAAPQTPADQLIALITQTIRPESWASNGGAGSVAVFRNKLIVKQSEATHKELAALLEMLRDKPATKAP